MKLILVIPPQHRSTPLEIPERSSCPHDITDLTLKSTDISCSYLALDITLDDFLELEDFLKLEDEVQPEDLGQDSELKLDDDRHTSEKDLETSPKASIDRNHLPCIDRHSLLNEPPEYKVELKPAEEIMNKSKASHLAVLKYIRPPIHAEEAAMFHKRVKRIHDLVKFVVPCAVFEVEFPILPNKSVHMGSYIGVLYNPLHAEASQRGTRFNSDVDKGPSMEVSNATNLISLIHTCRVSEQKEFEVCQNIFDGGTTGRSDKFAGEKSKNWKKRKMTMGGPQLSSIPHFSYGVKKYRVRNRCHSQPFAKVLLFAEMIDKEEEPMMAFT
uniref:Uncharacterized protein n=1 Tax=Brassica oleracea var. oleracea TaxID=109376 RepID=A0A0D3EA99_BRAOL